MRAEKMETTALAAAVSKPPRRRARDEEREQRCLVEWANTRRYTHTTAAGNEIEIVLGDYLVASANGAYLSGDQSIRARQWQRLKAMGCRPGASDPMLYVPTATYHGMSIEMKKRHNQFRSDTEATMAVCPSIYVSCSMFFMFAVARPKIRHRRSESLFHGCMSAAFSRQ